MSYDEINDLEINLLTKSIILEIGRKADLNCSLNCKLDEAERKLLKNFDKDDFNIYKSKFKCFDTCLSKYFSSSLIGLNTIKNKIYKI